jgi:pyridoxine 5'-phosphate synthase PdxJ
VLRQVVRTKLNLEMAATQEMLRVALTVKPEQATLVPERREELTTEGGLDVVLNSVQLRPIVKTLAEGGIEVSIFLDPDLEQVKEAHKLDAQAVEINTASWADARDAKQREAALRRIVDAARWASGWACWSTPGTASPTRTSGPSPPCRRSPSSTSATASSRARCSWAWSARCARWPSC